MAKAFRLTRALLLTLSQHSYTQLLLDSIPTLKHKWSRVTRRQGDKVTR
jgi:hypothetical protein